MPPSKKSIKYSDTYKAYFNKEPYNSHCVYTIFRFVCPLFLLEVTNRYNYDCNNCIDPLPEPDALFRAVIDFFQSGEPLLIYKFDSVRFWYKGRCADFNPEDNVFVDVLGNYWQFVRQFKNFYDNFYKNYNLNNYLVK